MKNIEQEGICCLCGEFKKLSFEHVPPQSAFNDKPIFIQSHLHLIEKDSYLFGKKSKSNKGFGGYTLCERCNNNTGDWYGRAFKDFAHQGMDIINKVGRNNYTVEGDYIIKPLNVIKQILVMFMSADKSGYLRSQKGLTDFLLNRDKTGLPAQFKIFLYSTLSPFKRMMGYSVINTTNMEIQKWSEINFQPFGYLLADDSNPAHEHMCDISEFASIPYDRQIEVHLTTAHLRVASPWIGDYR